MGSDFLCPLVPVLSGSDIDPEFRDQRVYGPLYLEAKQLCPRRTPCELHRALFRSSFLLTMSLHSAASAAIFPISSSTVNLFLFLIAVALTAVAASSNRSYSSANQLLFSSYVPSRSPEQSTSSWNSIFSFSDLGIHPAHPFNENLPPLPTSGSAEIKSPSGTT